MSYEIFLDRSNKIAVAGVSSDRNKWGWKIYKELKSAGFEAYAVNPKHKKIGSDICYPNLKSLPLKPDMVVTVVKPEITEKIVKECRDLNINKVWMQPGSESEKAINFCRNNNIKAVHNACFVVKKKFD